MEEERKEETREQAMGTVSEAASREQNRKVVGSAVSFFLGLIIGAIATLAIAYATWKMPLDIANEQIKTLESQVQMAQKRVDKMRGALTRAQEALTALNEALQELSPKTTQTPQPPRGESATE